MDAVAAVYRTAASLSAGIGGLRSHVDFHCRSRFDSTITVHDRLNLGGDTRYTLSAEGIRYVTLRDCAQLPTTREANSYGRSPPRDLTGPTIRGESAIAPDAVGR